MDPEADTIKFVYSWVVLVIGGRASKSDCLREIGTRMNLCRELWDCSLTLFTFVPNNDITVSFCHTFRPLSTTQKKDQKKPGHPSIASALPKLLQFYYLSQALVTACKVITGIA